MFYKPFCQAGAPAKAEGGILKGEGKAFFADISVARAFQSRKSADMKVCATTQWNLSAGARVRLARKI
jgi:hypothetical protein